MPNRFKFDISRLSLIYISTYLLNSPLFAMYSILQFILCKDLRATGLQITILISAKPLAALFSSYWSSLVNNRRDRLNSNIVWASIIGALPTLLFPFIHNNWFLIFGCALFFFTERAIIPAWMEILKISLKREEQSAAVSAGSLVTFVMASFVPLFIGSWMDVNAEIWKFLFPVLGLFSLSRVILQSMVCFPQEESKRSTTDPWSFRKFVFHPWNLSWKTLRGRFDFSYYQLIFFFGGLGLMVMQPALPRFVEGVLRLSYTELAFAFAVCKGLGFFATSPLWAYRIHRTNIFSFCGFVALSAACSIALIILSQRFPLCIYFASFCYGAMQAGSQLSWQLGGPIFSPLEDSSAYTSVNVILVGIRGCIGPFVGAFIYSFMGEMMPFFLGCGLCLVGGIAGIIGSKLVVYNHQVRMTTPL